VEVVLDSRLCGSGSERQSPCKCLGVVEELAVDCAVLLAGALTDHDLGDRTIRARLRLSWLSHLVAFHIPFGCI
jgi:hypothetical protein